MRINFSNKGILYTMCLVVTVILVKNIIVLHNTAWQLSPVNALEDISGYKYILLWTSPGTIPFIYMGEGRKGFVSRKCPFTNCIVTANRSLLSNYTLFDVIAFHGPELSNLTISQLPSHRSPHQKYVFASIESPANYPICTDYLNGYFNWTWTYKLDSEVRWGYLVIRDSQGKVIGPNQSMKWLQWNKMSEVSDKIKMRLNNKTKAVAWFVSNCMTESRREDFALSLENILKKRYNLSMDVIGDCSYKKCPREVEEECNEIIENDYYFYLAFENSFSEDYATEKLLIPLQHNTIPIVYGGANYTRFLPPGSYLNARQLGLKKLARKMNELINYPEKYAQYFRWKNHYSYHKTTESVETDEYCQMCSILNDEQMVTRTSVYADFDEWWDKEACRDEW